MAAASHGNMIVVPISECTEDVANRLLSFSYTVDVKEYIKKYISESSALPLASLAHKPDMKVGNAPH